MTILCKYYIMIVFRNIWHSRYSERVNNFFWRAVQTSRNYFMEGKTMMNFTITFSLTQVLMLAIVIYLVAMFIIICSGKRGIGYSLLKLVLTTIMVVGLITYVVMNKMFQDRNENIILAMSYIVVLIFHKVIREVKLMAKRKMKQKNKEKEQKQQIEE